MVGQRKETGTMTPGFPGWPFGRVEVYTPRENGEEGRSLVNSRVGLDVLGAISRGVEPRVCSL